MAHSTALVKDNYAKMFGNSQAINDSSGKATVSNCIGHIALILQTE